jgi:putative ABC transport system permease protein
VSPRRPTAGWRILVGTGTGAGAALGLLVLVAVFVAVAVPRASLSLRTHALQQTFDQLPASARTVTATMDFQSFSLAVGSGNPTDQMAGARGELAGQLTAAKVPIQLGAAWSSLSTEGILTSGAPRRGYYGPIAPGLQLVYRDALRHYARLQAGAWPGNVTRNRATTTFQGVVTQATATQFGLHVGSRLDLGKGASITVCGIVDPVSPASAFWTEFAGADTPTFTTIPPPSGGGFWTGAAFLGAAEIPALMSSLISANTSVSWVYPLNLTGVSADHAPGLLQDITAGNNQSSALLAGPDDVTGALSVSSGVSQTLATFVTTEQADTGILSLLFVSLTVLGAVVLLLCTQLAADRRNDEFIIMRARGAGRWQLGWLALRGSLLITGPAAVLAVLLAVAVTPDGGNTLAWWLALATALTGLLGPVLLAARRDPTARRSRRSPAAARRLAGARRLALELTLTGMAVAGLIVLRQQGLSSSGSVDALASAAPVLVAGPAAIIMVRLCPLVLGWLLRLARRGRGVIAFVGLARGAQRAAATLLPVFALVLALAVVTFGGTVRSAVNRGETATAWQLAGADAMVGSPGSAISLTAPAIQAMASVRGVQLTATAVELNGVFGPYVDNGTTLNAAFVDPRQYAAVLARTPAPPFPAAALARPARSGGPVPVVTSPETAALLSAAGDITNINGRVVRVVVKGEVATTPAAPAGEPFIVLPLWAEGSNLPPNMMLLSGPHIDQAALSTVAARTAPAVPVTFRSAVQASLAAAPLPGATYTTYAQGAAAAAVFSVLVVLISLLLGARTRELTDARLATMGLSAGQARRVGVVESIPFIAAAAVGGVVAAVALVPLIAPTLDLSVFTGGPASVRFQPDIPTLVIAAVVLVVLALATLAGQAAAAHRRGVGRALRVGE